MTPVWLDLIDPSIDDVLATTPSLDPEAIEILTTPARGGRGSRPFLQSHGSYLVGVFISPTHDDDANTFRYQELACVVSHERLVTVRKSDERGGLVPITLAGRAASAESVGDLLHELVDDVAEEYLDLVDALYSEIDELEDAIDDISSEETRRRLAGLRHEMLHARKNVSATRAAVRRIVDGRLDVASERLFSRDAERSFADTYDTLVRTTEELDVARDLLASVRDYLQAKVSESQNEVVKTLTVIASLVLVPTLITGFFGQNFEPVFTDRFWTLGASVALIALTTIVQLVVFRWRKWI